MVEFIKFLPSPPTSIPSHIHKIQNRLPSDQISLPIFFSTVNNNPQNDRHNAKRWIGRCPGDPPRQLNISDTPYSIHRKVIYRELARYYPATTVDMCASIRIKQQQKSSNREPLKATIGAGATVTTVSNLSLVDAENSHLFDALSKHVTIKAEPLRPSNNFINNTNSTLSSWQKYWTSTHTQRRRKEAADIETALYRPTNEKPALATTHFVTIRDSKSHTTSENNSNSRSSSTASISCTPTKPSSPIVSDKQSSFIKDDHFYLPRIISPREKTSSANMFKYIEETSLSPIPSESTIISENNEVQKEINTITTKIYKLPLPSNKPKTNKLFTKRGSRSTSIEKNSVIPPTSIEKKEKTTKSQPDISLPKQKRQISSKKPHPTTTKNQQPLPTIPVRRWDEPYVGVRFDPPTPPCSPSLFIWPQNSDRDENDTPFPNEVYL